MVSEFYLTGLKNVNLSMMLKGTLFQKTQRWRLPGPHQQKTRDKLHLFPQTFNIWQCCHRYTRPKWFSSFPQTVPSKIPTRLYRPLTPQSFGLVLDQSSLTYKEITIHLEIIDSDYFKKSNYDVISDTMTIQKGGQNCPITSFTLYFY